MRVLLNIFILFLLSSCTIKNYREIYPGNFYKTKKGDRLEALAQKHKISVNELREINGLEGVKKLPEGRMLYIPDHDPIRAFIVKKHEEKKLTNTTGFKEVKKAKFDFPLDQGKILYFFSKDKKNPYEGLGIKANLGQKVNTIASGRILYQGDEGTRFGMVVIIEHDDDFISVYAHLKEAFVKEGQEVKKRAIIGTAGVSGGLIAPMLHLQLRKNQKCIDPKPYLL